MQRIAVSAKDKEDLMSENYPEIDVDTKFMTNKKGVFQRFREYNEKIYYEFQEYKQRIMYDKLSEYLKNNEFELIYK